MWISLRRWRTLLSSDFSSCFCLQRSSSLRIRPHRQTHFTPGALVTATKRPTARFSRALPLFLSVDEFGEIGLQLALLVDPPLLHTVPALLLSDAQRAGDVVAKVQPLLFCQIISWRRKQRGFLMQCCLRAADSQNDLLRLQIMRGALL